MIDFGRIFLIALILAVAAGTVASAAIGLWPHLCG